MKFAATLALAVTLTASSPVAEQVLRGHIRQVPGKPSVIELADHKTYIVSGDDFTKAQMTDPKLNGREIEIQGQLGQPGQFEATHLYTIKDGKRYKVTYWCDICSIRTHMPGRCMCCQGETELQELPVP